MTSKLEKEWRDFIISVFPKKLKWEFNVRPSFLVNPITGKNLELDIYCDKYFLAIEVDGDQHHRSTRKFYKSVSDFKHQKEKDRMKNELCKRFCIKLIRVNRRTSKIKVRDEIEEYLREIIIK